MQAIITVLFGDLFPTHRCTHPSMNHLYDRIKLVFPSALYYLKGRVEIPVFSYKFHREAHINSQR